MIDVVFLIKKVLYDNTDWLLLTEEIDNLINLRQAGILGKNIQVGGV